MRAGTAGIVEQLRRFNRKERFYLVGLALGWPEQLIRVILG